MHSYPTELILRIDAALAISIAVLSITVIIYSYVSGIMHQRRNAALLKIKKNVFDLVLSGTKLSANVCAPFSSETSQEQFIDIVTNRSADAVFFSEEEQDVFRHCLATPEKKENMRRLAGSSLRKWKRIEAMLGLAYIGDAESVGIFKKALSASDADMKYFAIAALGQIKNEESAATLINLLRTDGAPKRKIVSLLEKFPDLIVSERLLPLMDERNTGTRFWSLKLMSRMNPGKHVDKISKMARDVSAEVRAAACECLGNSKNKAAADTLSSALGDENWLVRASSVKALSTLLGDDSIPKIIALLKDSSLSVLSAVKDALVDHIDRAMPYIEKIYSGDDKMAALICVEAVQEAKRGKA